MSDPVTFGLIGTGGIAQSYAQALETTDRAKIVAVCDVRLEAASATAARFGIPAYAAVEDLLKHEPTVEAVIICTPPNTHEAITVQCLRAGVHVLCEKPFTLTPASARRMVNAAGAEKRLLTMASKFRCVDDVVKAKSIMTSGILGEVILFENAFTGRVDMENRWNSKLSVSGGGVLIDNGTHSVDLMRYFLGPLAEVHSVEGKRTQNLDVEDTVRIFVRSAAGVMGSVDLSWSLNKELDWYVNIYGSQGTIQVGWKESRYRQAGGKDWVVFGTGYHKVNAFRNQIQNFARAVRGEEQLLVTSEDAIASVDVVEAAYRSLRTAPWTGVRTPSDLTQTPPPSIVSLSPEGSHVR